MSATVARSSKLKPQQGYILDVGCGKNKGQANAVGMDCRSYPGVDVVHDWNDYPWPFEDESALTILALDVVEHVNPADGGFVRWMDECWRILKPDAQIAIATPYAGSSKYWADPTHCNPCTHMTFWYFDPAVEYPVGSGNTLYGFYEPAPWEIERVYYRTEGPLELSLKKRPDHADYHYDGKIHYR